jgi:hypothetical protein
MNFVDVGLHGFFVVEGMKVQVEFVVLDERGGADEL